ISTSKIIRRVRSSTAPTASRRGNRVRVNEDIARALASAFPESTITEADLTPITGGRSGATVLGFSAGGQRWILRKKNPHELGKELGASGRRAPCHRDLNPMNILASDRGVLFVDWDTASQDEPFLDVAELGAFTPTADAREALFAAYLDRAPTDAERDAMKT